MRAVPSRLRPARPSPSLEPSHNATSCLVQLASGSAAPIASLPRPPAPSSTPGAWVCRGKCCGRQGDQGAAGGGRTAAAALRLKSVAAAAAAGIALIFSAALSAATRHAAAATATAAAA